MSKKPKLKFLKKTKMYYDIANLFPKKFEDHVNFYLKKDIPFKQDIEYFFNQDNNVGDDFVKNPDILAMGCSITVPVGIAHGLSWPHLIKDELNESLNVLAYGGGSIQRIIHNATLHMIQYGIPKKIYFLLPSLDRAWIPQKIESQTLPKLSYNYMKNKDIYDISNNNYYELSNFFWIEEVNSYISRMSQSNWSNFSYKDFLDIKRSIPLEYGLHNQLHSLMMFFASCKLLGIECFYYSWNGNIDDIIGKLDLFNDIAVFSKKINDHCYWGNNGEIIDFDLSYFSNNEEHKKYWEKGLDKPESNAHPGMYTHIHMAERFIGRRLSQKTIDEAKC